MGKKNEVIKDILAVLGVLGLVTIAVAAPNLVQVFGPKYNSAKRRYQLKKSLKILEKDKLVTIGQKNGSTVIQLTKNGRKKHLEYKLEDMKLKKPKVWDKKWRLVIFDIPITHNYARLVFSSKLKDLGFYMIQKSVWVHPYECEDEIDFIKEIFEIRPFVRVVTAESIDIAHDLTIKFNLNK
jgi:DNA-binding transcriptional regulator PaaX